MYQTDGPYTVTAVRKDESHIWQDVEQWECHEEFPGKLPGNYMLLKSEKNTTILNLRKYFYVFIGQSNRKNEE